MANNNRISLPMFLNGIIKVEAKVDSSGEPESILETYKEKIWVNQISLREIEILIAARRYNYPLKEATYYRFDGPVIVRENTTEPLFLPEGTNTVEVGTNFIRPLSLANKIVVNGRSVIIQLQQQHNKKSGSKDVVITALHRHRYPASGRMETFSTDYKISELMLLSIDVTTFSVGRCFEFKGVVSGYSNRKGRFIITCREDPRHATCEAACPLAPICPVSPRPGERLEKFGWLHGAAQIITIRMTTWRPIKQCETHKIRDPYTLRPLRLIP
ncbi:hypothetical protein DFH28DRAFT_922762 [Melampsora americana]|nr:hypothetical protein DFH28DRAFT_922762 [Melampsora americana]